MQVKIRDRLGKKLNIIYPGEYFFTREDELIGTLLGSCVAICLYDEANPMGAMNHYMLPGRIAQGSATDVDVAKYGLNSINTIIRLMLDNGASRKTMTARIFGGGNMLKSMSTDGRISLIPSANVRVARLILEMEDIPIISSDVGEDYTRKIIFDTHTGKVYLRKMKGEDIKNLVYHRDEKFLE